MMDEYDAELRAARNGTGIYAAKWDHKLTVMARSQDWAIFDSAWEFFAQFPALSLVSLCALSVGLHPYFADPAWVLNVALPHFEGIDADPYSPLAEATEKASHARLLDVFLRRVKVTAGNLAPLGALPGIDAPPMAELTQIKVADFVVFAEGMGWPLPDEFPRQKATGGAVAEGQQANQVASDETGSSFASKPKPRQRSQEEAILSAIKDLGLDPQSLPAMPRGKGTVKAKVREALKGDPHWGGRVFDKAWERLRADGRVKEETA